MRPLVRTLTVIVIALLAGWAVGRAQTSNPDFEIVVNAPGGETVECIRGCGLKCVERGLNPNSDLTNKFTFSGV